ncbi:MAG: VWA domain-containing protein [Holophagales bacterium]|nr:VWA domain-containing protein [Holophagales bacterium]MYD22327.1 VWA domain-containing protein [Holophagales bacterium]MYI34133.1 VWA domain-containing protein [Holophagales bacterium]
MISTCSRHRLLPAVVALLAALCPAAATAQMPSREAEIILQVPASGPLREFDARSFEILENGATREILSVEPVAERWRIVIYFDLPGSTPEGIEAAAAAVGNAADALVALGDVEMIAADRIAEVELAPTANAGAVRAAAAAVATRAGAAGVLLDRRRDLRAAADARSGDPDADALRTADLLEGVLLELDTLRWQRANLLESIEGASWAAGQPRALFLVRDATDLNADAFAEELLGEPTPAFERAALSEQRRQRSLTRTVAALGWRVYSLQLAPAAQEVDDLLPGRVEASRAFSHAAGGEVLADAAELAAATERLRASWRVRYRSSGTRDGAAHPVDVRIASDAASSGPPPDVSARRWATVAAPADLVALRASRALDALSRDGDRSILGGNGELAIRGVLLPQGIQSTTEGAPAEFVTLDGLATVGADPPQSSDALRLTVYGRGLDAPAFLLHRGGNGTRLREGAWRFRTLFDLPVAIDELVLMVEDLRNDRWQVEFLETASSPLDDRGDIELLVPEPGPDSLTARRTETEILTAARAAARRAGWAGGSRGPRRANILDPGPGSSLVRLIPPRGERSGLSGRKSFSTVTTSDVVRRVEFYLDGEQVFDDRRKPFQTTIDLGPEAVPHTIRIVAYDRSDRWLSEDELTINEHQTRAGVGIAAVEEEPGGRYAVEARVELAGGRVLDRVEFYRNDRLAATMTRPPFRTVLPGPALPGADFARVAVHLDDGTIIEDVEFLSADTPMAETVVNLVEVYVIVNDDEGKPITTLEPDDFVLKAGRREIPIERFAVAEDVPLVLGLAVDSSQSMWALMPDTRQAAARFLGNTLTRIDQAFVVDFDTRPRLLSDTTADVGELIGTLGKIQADGFTALYDAMQFCLVHLARDQGRRALVVLTDGDDYGSQSGYRRTFRTAGNTGVPIYVISMSQGEDRRGRGPRKLDLEAITKASGGRVYYVASMEAVFWAYGHIGEELRSQYMLGYSTSEPLTPREVQSIKVELRDQRNDREVRMTVGRGRG